MEIVKQKLGLQSASNHNATPMLPGLLPVHHGGGGVDPGRHAEAAGDPRQHLPPKHRPCSHPHPPYSSWTCQAPHTEPLRTSTGAGGLRTLLVHVRPVQEQAGRGPGRGHVATRVSKVLYSNFGAELSTFTEEDIKSNITRYCVTQQTSQARATELHRLKQEPAQSVSTFLATLKAKARQCDLKTECGNCHNMVDFSEKTLLTLFLRGLSDTELQQDLLAEQDLSLEKCLRIATARETAKRSQETFNTTSQAVEGISAYKEEQKRIKMPPDCCKYCGNKKHSDKNSCPAKDTVCTCGKTGHYRHLCFSPTTTVIRVASKEKLTVLGFIPVAVQVVGHPDKQTVQALYITKELTSLFISRTCLLELGWYEFDSILVN